jgi:V-ATPase subunit H
MDESAVIRIFPSFVRPQEAKRYPQALLKVLINITDVRLLQYALTLIADFLSVDTQNRAKYFTRPGAPPADRRLHFLPFLQLVGTSGSGAVISSLDANPYVLEHAAICASLLLTADCSDAHATSSMLAWVMTHIKNYGSPNTKQVKVTEVAVSALRILLRHDFLRSLFVDEHGVERLLPMLTARNVQLLYETAFCLWALSLHQPTCPLLERSGAVSGVARLARTSNMPLKVLRVSLAMLANVARHPDCGDSLAEICETHVPETVEALLNQEPKINDPEMVRQPANQRDSFERAQCIITSLFILFFSFLCSWRILVSFATQLATTSES